MTKHACYTRTLRDNDTSRTEHGYDNIISRHFSIFLSLPPDPLRLVELSMRPYLCTHHFGLEYRYDNMISRRFSIFLSLHNLSRPMYMGRR